MQIKNTSLNTSNSVVHGQKRNENMNMLKLYSKEQSLFKTTEITQANPYKSIAFTIATIESN